MTEKIILGKSFGGGNQRIIFGTDADALPRLGATRVINVGKIRAVVKRHFGDLCSDQADGDACPGAHGRIEQKLSAVGCVKNAVDVAIILVLVTDGNINKVGTICKRKHANVLHGGGNLNGVDLFLPVKRSRGNRRDPIPCGGIFGNDHARIGTAPNANKGAGSVTCRGKGEDALWRCGFFGNGGFFPKRGFYQHGCCHLRCGNGRVFLWRNRALALHPHKREADHGDRQRQRHRKNDGKYNQNRFCHFNIHVLSFVGKLFEKSFPTPLQKLSNENIKIELSIYG